MHGVRVPLPALAPAMAGRLTFAPRRDDIANPRSKGSAATSAAATKAVSRQSGTIICHRVDTLKSGSWTSLEIWVTLMNLLYSRLRWGTLLMPYGYALFEGLKGVSGRGEEAQDRAGGPH